MIPRFLLPSLFILSSPMSQVWKIAARKEGEENISDYFLLILFYHGEVKVARSSLTLCDPMDFFTTSIHPWHSPGQNTGVGSCSLLQGIFPTQGSNPGLLHCRQIPYQLSHKGSPFYCGRYTVLTLSL